MSEVFLNKFFSKLTESDFEFDSELKTFYSYYIKQLETTPDISLLKCYINYIITKNRSNVPNVYNLMCDELKFVIMQANTPQIDIKKFNLGNSSGSCEIHNMMVPTADNLSLFDINKLNNNDTETKKTVKLNKKKTLIALSDFIKFSFTSGCTNQQNTEVENHMSGILEEEMKFELKSVNKIKDKNFEKKMNIIEQIQDTLESYKCLIVVENMYKILRKTYFIHTNINGQPLNLNSKNIDIVDLSRQFITLNESQLTVDDANIKISIPSKFNETRYQEFDKKILFGDYISIASELSSSGMKLLVGIFGSQMTFGGITTCGIQCTETQAYLCTTYGIISYSMQELSSDENVLTKSNTPEISDASINDVMMSLQENSAILMPNILIFKNQETYKTLNSNECKKISILNIPIKINSKLNIKIDPYDNKEEKLLSIDTLLQDSSYIINKIRLMFISALHFGYSHILLTDMDLFTNNYPVIQIAKIFSDVIKEFSHYFQYIGIVTDKKCIYDIFKQYV